MLLILVTERCRPRSIVDRPRSVDELDDESAFRRLPDSWRSLDIWLSRRRDAARPRQHLPAFGHIACHQRSPVRSRALVSVAHRPARRSVACRVFQCTSWNGLVKHALLHWFITLVRK